MMVGGNGANSSFGGASGTSRQGRLRSGTSSQTTLSPSSHRQSNKKTCCGKCKSVLKDSVDCSILCDSCSCWFHTKCTDLSKSEADFVSRLEQKGVSWDCDNCRVFRNGRGGQQIDRIEQSIDSLKSMITDSLEPRFETIERSYAEAVVSIEKSVNGLKTMIPTTGLAPNFEAIEKSYANAVKNIEVNSSALAEAANRSVRQTELDQKQVREKNMIVFGIPESITKQDSVDELQKILNECHINIKLKQNDIYRLGRVENMKTDGDNKKIPRPLKVITESREQKWDILKRVNSQRIQGIFAKPDLTREEREADFHLRTELKKTRAENPDNTYKIYRNRVTKTNT